MEISHRKIYFFVGTVAICRYNKIWTFRSFELVLQTHGGTNGSDLLKLRNLEAYVV